MMCSFAARSFSAAPAPAAARSRSSSTRPLHLRSHLLRLWSPPSSSRARRYASNASSDTLLAMSLSAKGARVATVRAFHGVGVRGTHHPAVALLELAEGFASLAPDVRLEAVPARVVTLGAAHALRDGAVAEAYRTRLHESGGEENVSRGLSEGARRRRRRARGTFVHPPALGVRGNAGARERPLARGQARARDVARTFTSAAIVAGGRAARRVQRTARCASPQIHTRSSRRRSVACSHSHGLCGAIFSESSRHHPRALITVGRRRERSGCFFVPVVPPMDDQSVLF